MKIKNFTWRYDLGHLVKIEYIRIKMTELCYFWHDHVKNKQLEQNYTMCDQTDLVKIFSRGHSGSVNLDLA